MGHSLLSPGLGLCWLMVKAGSLHIWVPDGPEQGERMCRRNTPSFEGPDQKRNISHLLTFLGPGPNQMDNFLTREPGKCNF